MGRQREAAAYFEESLALLRAAHGNDHRLVAQALGGRGRLAKRREDYARAEADFREVVRILSASFGPDHQFTMLYDVRHADALRLLGREAAAAAAFADAMPTARASIPEGAPNRAIVERLYGEYLASRGRCADAREALDAAGAIFHTLGDESQLADIERARQACMG